MNNDLMRIGLVDGSVDSNSRTFHVVLDAATVIQLDELVAVSTELPDGRVVTHYGIVTELLSRFEGADLPSDTGRVIDRTLPAELVRRAEVRMLRWCRNSLSLPMPEPWRPARTARTAPKPCSRTR